MDVELHFMCHPTRRLWNIRSHRRNVRPREEKHYQATKPEVVETAPLGRWAPCHLSQCLQGQGLSKGTIPALLIAGPALTAELCVQKLTHLNIHTRTHTHTHANADTRTHAHTHLSLALINTGDPLLTGLGRPVLCARSVTLCARSVLSVLRALVGVLL